ncbi:hypothetical protein ABZ281_29475, partial [Streptomyces sp. NPDC006265]
MTAVGGAGPGGGTGPRGTGSDVGRGLLVVGDVITDVVARHRGPLAAGTDTAASIRTVAGGAGARASEKTVEWEDGNTYPVV